MIDTPAPDRRIEPQSTDRFVGRGWLGLACRGRVAGGGGGRFGAGRSRGRGCWGGQRWGWVVPPAGPSRTSVNGSPWVADHSATVSARMPPSWTGSVAIA